MTSIFADKNLGNIGDWQTRHDNACTEPRLGPELAITKMMDGWGMYASTHKTRFESPIGADYVLGPAWEQIGDSLRTLLNGELGRLDGGTLDAFILGTMKDNGIDTESK